jgi:hypothetical protein
MRLSKQTALILSCILIAAQTTLESPGELNPNLSKLFTFLVAALQGILTNMAYNRYPSGEKLFRKRDYFDESESGSQESIR